MNRLFLASGFIAVFLFAGCTGKSGPAGPSGNAGNPAANTFQATFQNGVYPNGSYSGETDTWLNGGASTTNESGNSFRRVMTGVSTNNYGRVLVKFDVTSLPVNAQVVDAEVILTTQTTTSIGSSPVTIGVHDLASSLVPSCMWTLSATWIEYNGASGWSVCDGDASAGQQGMYNPTTMSAVVFTNSANGQSNPYKWTIFPSVVTNWLAGKNDGLIFRSEGEFGEPTANVDFYPYNDATAGNHAILLVSYQ